jgi:hypothetical protein
MLHELERPSTINNILKRPECPLLAQSGHAGRGNECLLSGAKRTFPDRTSMSAFDPKQTWRVLICCVAQRRLSGSAAW